MNSLLVCNSYNTLYVVSDVYCYVLWNLLWCCHSTTSRLTCRWGLVCKGFLIKPIVELTIVPGITIRILSSILYYFYFSKYILNWIVFDLKRLVGSQVVILDFCRLPSQSNSREPKIQQPKIQSFDPNNKINQPNLLFDLLSKLK